MSKINWFSWYVVWIIITLSAEFPGWPTKYGPNILSLCFGGDSSGWRTSTVWLWCFRPTVVFLPSNPRHLSIDIPMAMKTICLSRLYYDSSRKKNGCLALHRIETVQFEIVSRSAIFFIAWEVQEFLTALWDRHIALLAWEYIHTWAETNPLSSWMKIDRIFLSEGVVGFDKMLDTAWSIPSWGKLCRFSLARER